MYYSHKDGGLPLPAQAFKALSDETRLRVLGLLTQQPCCVCEVMQALDISQTRASRALSTLHDAGFLKLQKEGLWSVYSLDREGMDEQLTLLVEAAVASLKKDMEEAKSLKRLRLAVRIGPGCVRRFKRSRMKSDEHPE